MSQEHYTSEELHKMSQAMAEDIRALKTQLDKERDERKRIEEELSKRENHYKELESTVEKVKAEKKDVYGHIINEDIKPWMTRFKEKVKDDKELVQSFDTIDSTLKKGLDNAFMNEEEKSLFRFVESVASADKVTSSTLAQLLRTEQEWGQKYEDLMKQKEAIEKEAAMRSKELEESTALKEKMVEDLKKELEELRATAMRAQNNINNVEGHFEGAAPAVETGAPPAVVPAVVPAVGAPTVTATASRNKGKFDSIFDFRPRTDWRTRYADPGVSSSSPMFNK